MREIKFRAWNWKEMRYDVNINDGKPVRKWYQWFSEWNDIHNSEPMQFTGLLDKNGKEIWESDILQYINNEWKLTDIYFVEWNKRWFIWRWSKRKEGEFNNCDGLDCPEKDMEIIWNIYENPELLWNQHK